MPNLKPFTGELDAAPATPSLKPFTGELDEESVFRKAQGVGEAGLNMLSTIPAALGGGLTYLGTLAATQDPQAALSVKQDTEKTINDLIEFEPETQAGKRYQKKVQEGMQYAIEYGGRYPEQVLNAATLGQFGKFDPEEALIAESIGKAGAEIGLNLVDPLAAAGIVRGGKKFIESKFKQSKERAAEAASKIEASLKPFEGELDVPNPELVPTIASADDFAAFNPYDVGGHVTAAEQGRPSTIDTAQGELFGGQVLQEAQPAPRGKLPEELAYGEQIPYEPVSLGDLPPQQARNVLDVPAVPDRLELVPKEAEVLPVREDAAPQTPVPEDNPPWWDMHLATKEWEKHNGPLPQPTELDLHRQRKQSNDQMIDALAADIKFESNRLETMRERGLVSPELYNEYQKTLRQSTDIFDLGERQVDFMERVDAIESMKKRLDSIEAANEAPKSRYELAQEKIRKQEETVRKAQEFLDRRKKGETDMQYARDVLQDSSLMREDATGQMRDAVEAGDARSALESISNNHENRGIRDLAQYLMSKAEGLKISMHEEGLIRMGDRDATGYFDPATGDIVLSGVGANSPHTVMHEIVHGLTSQFMQGRPNDFRVRAMEQLYKKLDLRDHPAVQNVREFVAEAFSNPEFQDYLKTQRVDSRNAWRKFVDTVKGIFGLREGPLANALDHTIDLGKQIIEASDAPTRQSLMEQFKGAGMNKKLADLMAVPEKPKTPETRQYEGVGALKIPALTDPVSDFKFLNKSPEEIKQMALEFPDIPNTKLEKMAQQLQSGGLAASLKTRNPIVKYFFERLSRAERSADYLIRNNLSDPKTGLKVHMRDMSAVEKGEIWASQMLNEGQRILSTEQLRQQGYNEKQIAYYNHYREMSGQFFKQINEVRERLGMRPMDERVGHIAGRFMGDFSRMVFSADGTKVVGRISGNTKWELDRATKFMKEQHPEWTFGDQEYNKLGRGHNPADRFGGLMEALNFLTKTDTDAKALMDSYKEYMQNDAINFLNATRSAKDKVKEAGGIKGSEGNKPWQDLQKNAEEGMKAQLAYFEQGYKWMEMEKAVDDLRQVTSDEAVVRAQPNAIKYGNAYLDHALHRNQGPLADAANWIASFIGEHSGLGHTNLFKASNVVKHRVLQKMMGFFNIPFSVAQLMQPIQANPAMVSLLKKRGLEFSAIDAQTAATNTYFKSLTGQKLDSFEQAAIKYANDLGIFDMKMSDHVKDINSTKLGETFDYYADMNIRVPEHFTRGNTFLFYSNLLKDAGVPMKDIFGTAENLTNFTMVDYRPLERPMGYAKLGWVGDVASALTRYKHNQLTQTAFYAREGIRGNSYAPLATYLAASLAFGGIMGFVGYQEADALYQLLSSKVLKKPDSLTNQVLKSDMPEVMSHGIFSTLGIDMASRFSNANIIPDNIADAMMPYGSAVWNMIDSTGRYLMDPTSPTKAKQAVKAVAPQSMQGALENTMFTEEKGPNQNLYVSSTEGPNFGKGRVMRTDEEVGKRWLGFRSVRESKELAQNYANTQIEKGNKEIVDRLLNKAKYAAMDDNLTPERIQDLAQQAADHGEDPAAFIGKIVTWSMDRELTQKQQMMLRNAQRGYRGAFNIREQQ
jgi:hypothetical protein